jgi:hypothetical protein
MKIVFLTLVAIACVHAQGRSQAEWMTSGADMQRSYSIPTDPKISVEGLSQPGFQFLWKTKLSDDALGAAMLMEHYIGYRGFRSLAFFSTARTLSPRSTQISIASSGNRICRFQPHRRPTAAQSRPSREPRSLRFLRPLLQAAVHSRIAMSAQKGQEP